MQTHTYLVVYLSLGMVTRHEYLPLPEAKAAIVAHCMVSPEDLYVQEAAPWGPAYFAVSDDGDEDAWAFPTRPQEP